MSALNDIIEEMLFSLVTQGESLDLTWTDFEQTMDLWIDEKSHRVDTLINRALDDVWRRYC